MASGKCRHSDQQSDGRQAMMGKYKAVIVGAGRMAGTIDDEVIDYQPCSNPYSHAAGYAAVPEVDLLAFAPTWI